MKIFTTLLVVVLWIILGNYLLEQNYALFKWQLALRFYIFTTTAFFGTGVYHVIKSEFK